MKKFINDYLIIKPNINILYDGDIGAFGDYSSFRIQLLNSSDTSLEVADARRLYNELGKFLTRYESKLLAAKEKQNEAKKKK